jgi:hypothetical protein
MKLQFKYPWDKVERGQGFFIPCLDTDAVKTKGLQQALVHRLWDARAKAGIRDGLIGVWFYRLPPALLPISESSSDESNPTDPASSQVLRRKRGRPARTG